MLDLFRILGALLLVLLFSLVGAASPEAENQDKSEDSGKSARITEFEIIDGATCNSQLAGDSALSGTLKLSFTGRILPHEETNVVLFGGNVSSIGGKFDEVLLPEGWTCDVEYDYRKPEVRARNFRPTRA